MQGYPNTYPSGRKTDPRIKQLELFDPALKQFPCALRLGDPIFESPEIQHQWLNIRLQVVDHLLQLISQSRWKEHLVLRGSVLLKVWLGAAAREPGDVDWVFRPENIPLNGSNALPKELFNELIQMVAENPHIGSVTIEIDKISLDDIWTYERAEGRRIVFPWSAAGLPTGALQMDVVFGESLLADPIQTSISLTGGSCASLWSASPALSLAWKLLWLETDSYPQGKDLYDATLLAEKTQLPFDLLRQVLLSNPDWRIDFERNENLQWRSGFPWMMDQGGVNWANFKLEYPWVEGTAVDWLTRLSQALAPTFAGFDDRLSPQQ